MKPLPIPATGKIGDGSTWCHGQAGQCGHAGVIRLETEPALSWWWRDKVPRRYVYACGDECADYLTALAKYHGGKVVGRVAR